MIDLLKSSTGIKNASFLADDKGKLWQYMLSSTCSGRSYKGLKITLKFFNIEIPSVDEVIIPVQAVVAPQNVTPQNTVAHNGLTQQNADLDAGQPADAQQNAVAQNRRMRQIADPTPEVPSDFHLNQRRPIPQGLRISASQDSVPHSR